MMLSYWLSNWFYENKYVFSILHNLIKLPPAFFLLWVHENGLLFFIRLWGILGDLAGSGIIYIVILKILKKPKVALWSLIFLLFNPLLIFDSSIWGQTDILSSLFALMAFLILNIKSGIFLSPIFFIIGISLKPTILLVLPIYLFLIARESFLAGKDKKVFLLSYLFGFVFSIILVVLSVIPFYDNSIPFSNYMGSILTRRILPSAKGATKVSTSAYTFYTIVYQIDKTPGDKKVLYLTLNQLGNIAFFLINITAFVFLLKKKEIIPNELTKLCVLVYFVVQGTFLFKTGMAERYFFPSVLFLYLLYFLENNKLLRAGIICQFILWFINLVTSFMLRDSEFLDKALRHQNFLGTRIVSLFNVLVYFYIITIVYFISKRKETKV